MKDTLKQLLHYNIKPLIQFEMIYKLASAVIFAPLFLKMLNTIMRFSGYSYLTFENIMSFLMHPMVICFLLLLVLLLTFYTLIDISTIIIILDCSYQKKSITVRDALFASIKCARRVFHRENIFLPFLVIFLIPFLNIGLSSGFISTLSLPEFITDYILNNTVLSSLYFIFLMFLAILLFRWLYVLHYFVLENCTFGEARKRSANLSKGHKIRDFIWIMMTQVAIVLSYVAFILLGIVVIVLLYKWLGGTNLLGNFSITAIWLLVALSFIVVVLLSTPISYAMTSSLYYSRKKVKKEKIKHNKISVSRAKVNRGNPIFKWSAVVLIFLFGMSITYSVIRSGNDLRIEYIRTMDVTAHRGASAFYPENTMRAFVGAKEMGADWIELDVQQTKDKVLIVLHDTNLKRTTGVSKNTWEVTYEEVRKLDAGSFFDEKFKGEKIPTLEEVIQFAQENHIKLNIELKPTGHEKNFEKDVVDIIHQYHFTDECVITSQVYDVLKKVKDYDSQIQTLYVMSLAYGDITKLDAADSFSIEASSVTHTLVDKVHNSGKELYAWTVNTSESINKMIDLNVDNIITDEIRLAKDLVYASKTSNIVQEYIKLIERVLG